MKTFMLGMIAGATCVHMLMDNKKSAIKKGKQIIKSKLEDILD